MKKIDNHIVYYDDKGILVDLTLMFGKGNEPSDINDERIKKLTRECYESNTDEH